MSAHFIVTFRGHPVRFTFSAGHRVWEVTERVQATPFISEADAWLAVLQHQMHPVAEVGVCAANQLKEAARGYLPDLPFIESATPPVDTKTKAIRQYLLQNGGKA